MTDADLTAPWLPFPAARPASGSDEVPSSPGDMVILVRGLTPTEAHLLCACLRSAGIQADAGDTHLVQADWLLAIAVGGACVRVPGAEAAEAREVVAAFSRGDLSLGDDFDPGDAAA